MVENLYLFVEVLEKKNSSGRFYVAHLEKMIGVYPEGTIFTVPDMGDDGLPFRVFEYLRI